MGECPKVGPRECGFNPGSECTEGSLTHNGGIFEKPCEICDSVIKYWMSKTLEVFHNPVCLIECEVRTGPECPYTRGEECPMMMKPEGAVTV